MTTNSKLILLLILRDIYTSLGSHLHQLHNPQLSLAGGRLVPPIRARQQVGPCCRSACGLPGDQEALTCWYYNVIIMTNWHCHTVTLSQPFILFTLLFSRPRSQEIFSSTFIFLFSVSTVWFSGSTLTLTRLSLKYAVRHDSNMHFWTFHASHLIYLWDRVKKKTVKGWN